MKEAVRTVKARLSSEPVLTHPDFTKPFIIQCDASPVAIAAVLSQVHDGVEHPVVFWSRALKPYEARYHQYEREALAVVWR